jgi:hypothetical protein
VNLDIDRQKVTTMSIPQQKENLIWGEVRKIGAKKGECYAYTK